jgi:hypothetical protein
MTLHEQLKALEENKENHVLTNMIPSAIMPILRALIDHVEEAKEDEPEPTEAPPPATEEPVA